MGWNCDSNEDKHKSNRKMLTGTWLSSQKVKQWGLKFRPSAQFDAFRPSFNTKQYAECYHRKCIDLKTLLIVDQNENAHNYILLVWTVENASKWKWWPKISQVHVLVAWAKSLTYVTTCNSIVFKCFSVHGYWKTCQKGSVDMKRSMCFQWQHTFEKALVWSGGPFRPGTCVPTLRGPRKHVSHEMRGKEETLSKVKEAQQDA